MTWNEGNPVAAGRFEKKRQLQTCLDWSNNYFPVYIKLDHGELINQLESGALPGFRKNCSIWKIHPKVKFSD